MAKIYTKATWTDEVLAYDETYQVKDGVGGTIIYPNAEITLASAVLTPGTAATAALMNNIENGIDDLDDLMVANKTTMTLDAAAEKTIASGVVAVTQTIIKLQPESSTADDLTGVTGMVDGQFVVFVVSDAGTDTITIKHGAGIKCPGGTDIALSYGGVWGEYDGTALQILGGGGGGSGINTCKATLTSNQSIPNTADTNIDFPSEAWDSNTMHDNSTNPSRITIKVSGYYFISAYIVYDTNASGIRSTQIKVNGSAVQINTQNTASAGNTQVSIGGQHYLSANDYVQVQVYQSSGGDLNAKSGYLAVTKMVIG